VARVLLVGSGPLPHENPERLGFPQLRVSWFLDALVQAGHTVRLVLLGEVEAPLSQRRWAGRNIEVVEVSVEAHDRVAQVRRLREEFKPDRVVSAGPYEPARVAALAVDEEPLFIDVPGDPFAEAQAKSAHVGEGDHSVQMREAWLPALTRADAFATISRSQRAALLGQLGLLGRLGRAPADHRWVEVMPAIYDFGSLAAAQPRTWRAKGELVVAISGGYNTWLDTDTLLDGLLIAMEDIPSLRVVSTGGGIPGHHTSSYEAFRARALASPHSRRFTFHGWVPHQVLPGLLSLAHIGVTLDRPGAEAELGTRTRVLFYAHQGLGVFATPRSDLTRELAGVRMIQPIAPGDPEHLAKMLRRAWEEGSDGTRQARLQGYLTSRYTAAIVTRPLLQWIEDAVRTEPVEDLASGLVREVAALRERLAEVHQSPTWRASSQARRVLGRLFGDD